jgi:hypothetical protein
MAGDGGEEGALGWRWELQKLLQKRVKMASSEGGLQLRQVAESGRVTTHQF